MANRDGWFIACRVEGFFCELVEEPGDHSQGRKFTIGASHVGDVYAGHCNPRFVTAAAVAAFRGRPIACTADAPAISAALAFCASRKAIEQAEETEAHAARDRQIHEWKTEFAYLEQGAGPVVAARNIRAELKRAFPRVKFSVRSERYSGGNSVNVYWTDGPTSERVKAISDKYQEGDFNGMDDSYNYRRSAWTNLFGGARYVFENRSESAELIAKAIEAARLKYGAKESPTVEDFQNGRAYGTPLANAAGERHWEWQSIIRRTISSMEA